MIWSLRGYVTLSKLSDSCFLIWKMGMTTPASRVVVRIKDGMVD